MAEKTKYRMGTGEKVFLWGFGVFVVLVFLVAVPALLYQRKRVRARAAEAAGNVVAQATTPASASSQAMLLWDGTSDNLSCFNFREYTQETQRYGSEMVRMAGGVIRVMSSAKGAFEAKGAQNELFAFRLQITDEIDVDPSILGLETEKNGVKYFKIEKGCLPEICFIKTLDLGNGAQQILMADYDEGSGGMSGTLSLVSLANQTLTMVAPHFAKFSTMKGEVILPKITAEGQTMTVSYFQLNTKGQWEKIAKLPEWLAN